MEIVSDNVSIMYVLNTMTVGFCCRPKRKRKYLCKHDGEGRRSEEYTEYYLSKINNYVIIYHLYTIIKTS